MIADIRPSAVLAAGLLLVGCTASTVKPQPPAAARNDRACVTGTRIPTSEPCASAGQIYSDKDIQSVLKNVETPQWAMLGYIGVMYAAAAMEKAKSTEADKVAAALEGLTIGTPVGSLTIDAKTHQANTGQFWGPMVKKPDRAYRMMEPAEYIQPK